MSYYQTACPRCHTDGLRLRQVSGVIYGVYITQYGFDLSGATEIDTQDETVWCGTCDYEGPLDSDAPTFDDDSTCQTGEHGCRDGDQVCGCRCDSCEDETEPKCNVCNAILEDGDCANGTKVHVNG